MLGKYGLLIVVTAALFGGAYAFWWSAGNQSSAERAYESVGDGGRKAEDGLRIPEYTADAARGRLAFNKTCAACHGRNAAGGPGGPPLIHKIYETGHHGDAAIERAVRNGVRAHHWKFGDMPPQKGITPAALRGIIAFIRETQRANGIF